MPDENEWQELQPMEQDPDDVAWENAAPEDTPEEEAWSEAGPEWTTGFDERFKRPFEGLAYLGALEADVTEVPYHSFRVRTLTTGEKIKVIALAQPYEDSIGYARAYRAAVVAAGLVLVDGKPLLVGQKNLDVIPQRYRYITDKWHDFVIDTLFDRIDKLEGEVVGVLRELGVFEGRREVVEVEEAENPTQE